MAKKSSRRTLQQELIESGHRWLISIPVVVAVACLVGQGLFTDYLQPNSLPALYAVLGAVVLLTIGESINPKPTLAWRVTEQLFYYAISVIGFGYLLPLPSPYLIFLILLGMLTSFNFGLRGMNLGLGALFGWLLFRYWQINDWHNPTQLSIFLVTYAITVVMANFAAAFLQLADDELQAVNSASAKARTNEQQVQSLINNITDGVIAVDADLNVILYNAAALDVLDLNVEIKHKPLPNFFKPIDAEQQPVDLAKLLDGVKSSVINRDLRLKYTDSSVINLFIGIAPIYLGYGRSAHNGYTLILRDITREKSLEEERDEFISVVSHELRTPIAISEGNVSNAEVIVEQGGDMATVKQALKETHNQILFLAGMINDLSTLSRAERGKLEVQVEAIDIPALISELVDNYRPEAEAKGLVLTGKVGPDAHELHSSKLYVREVLQNFITNAIKYTDSGSVTIDAEIAERGIRFMISDTGIGISKADQERVFDKFFRSEDFRTRKANGTGLGLYVTMKLARMLHADIDLKSELNQGSTFTIFIPNLQTEAASEPHA
jgi:signal transduction histidine kinase